MFILLNVECLFNCGSRHWHFWCFYLAGDSFTHKGFEAVGILFDCMVNECVQRH